jgi:glycosyltransferase involved in cell wall biosynthesis
MIIRYGNERLAIFLATSGHSGVDRIMKNLIPAFAKEGIRVDLLHVENHGPYLETLPNRVRILELGTAHTYTSLKPLVGYLRSEQPSVMLSDKDRVNRIALLARRLARVSTRVVVRTGTTVSKDLETRSPLDRLAHYLSMHYAYPQADAIIVPSLGAAVDLASFAKIPLDRISVVPSPIATPEIYKQALEELGHSWLAEKKMPVILGVGELCARKDFKTLIYAFAKVRKSRPCKLLILGRGRLRKDLEALVKRLNLTGEIELPGFVKNPYAYMARADIFVHSARYEGAPVALMEALSLGRPVVSTDCPSGPREILQGGVYGRLVPVGDPDAMARAILDTLDNPSERSFLKQAAAPFTLEASVSKYLKVLGF